MNCLKRIKKALKTILPESVIRILRTNSYNRVTGIFLALEKRLCGEGRYKYILMDDSYRLYFNRLKQEIVFPYRKGENIFFSGTDLPGYFQEDCIKKDDLVLDVGAWPGEFTTIASKLVGKDGLVLAFEPNPVNRDYLEKTLETNDIRNAIVFSEGIYSSATELPFVLNNAGSCIANCRKDRHSSSEKETVRVKTTTIDKVLEKYNPQNRRVAIKMDIEGAEVDALKGANKTLKGNPSFMIASYHLIDGRQSYVLLEDIFREKGFSVQHLYPKHLTTYASKLNLW